MATHEQLVQAAEAFIAGSMPCPDMPSISGYASEDFPNLGLSNETDNYQMSLESGQLMITDWFWYQLGGRYYVRAEDGAPSPWFHAIASALEVDTSDEEVRLLGQIITEKLVEQEATDG